MTWNIEFLDEAEKDMKKLDHSVQIQVLNGIRKVGQNPPPAEEGVNEKKSYILYVVTFITNGFICAFGLEAYKQYFSTRYVCLPICSSILR